MDISKIRESLQLVEFFDEPITIHDEEKLKEANGGNQIGLRVQDNLFHYKWIGKTKEDLEGLSYRNSFNVWVDHSKMYLQIIDYDIRPSLMEECKIHDFYIQRVIRFYNVPSIAPKITFHNEMFERMIKRGYNTPDTGTDMVHGKTYFFGNMSKLDQLESRLVSQDMCGRALVRRADKNYIDYDENIELLAIETTHSKSIIEYKFLTPFSNKKTDITPCIFSVYYRGEQDHIPADVRKIILDGNFRELKPFLEMHTMEVKEGNNDESAYQIIFGMMTHMHDNKYFKNKRLIKYIDSISDMKNKGMYSNFLQFKEILQDEITDLEQNKEFMDELRSNKRRKNNYKEDPLDNFIFPNEVFIVNDKVYELEEVLELGFDEVCRHWNDFWDYDETKKARLEEIHNLKLQEYKWSGKSKKKSSKKN